MKCGWLVFLVACAGPQHAAVPADPPRQLAVEPAAAPAAATPAPAPAPVPTIDEATLIAQSHAWLDTWDRYDSKGFVEPLAPSFVQFEEARFISKALIVERLDRYATRHAAPRTRTWKDEHTIIAGGTAIFIGEGIENVPADGDRPAMTQDGYNTMVWAHDGTRWVVAHWQWSKAGLDAERDHWNDRFRQPFGFNTKPNQLLVDSVKGKKPGTALDVGMGQGRNAVFLATQGWKTTGVDISDEGIKVAKAEAARLEVKLDTVQHDFDTYDFGKAKWDLVTMIYAGNDAALVEKIKPSLKKGGLFISEYFHADTDVAKSGAGGWKTGELAALFKDGFKILRDDVVEDNADWAGQRKTKLVRFVAQKL